MESKEKFRPDPNLRLMDQVRQVLRYHHYAYRTEQAYCDWIRRYIRFHGMRAREELFPGTDRSLSKTLCQELFVIDFGFEALMEQMG